MRAFEEFRYWVRRAPTPERTATLVAVGVVLALLGWLLVPEGTPSPATTIATGTGSAVDAPVSGTASPTSTLTTGSSPAAPGAATGVPSSASPAGTSSVASSQAGCTSPPGSARGVTATEIKIAVTVADIAGPASNTLFGIPSADDGVALYRGLIDAINARGGIACRKVVARFYKVNPSDQADMHAKCLDAAQAGVYADIDAGGYGNSPEKGCFPQHGIVYFGNNFVFASEQDVHYPLLFSLQKFDLAYRNMVMALRDRGFFSPGNGFVKLGFIYRSCNKPTLEAMKGWLREAGIADEQLVSYDVGCPRGFASPADLQQAVLQFQSSGVTHLTTMEFLGDYANFTKIAQQQGFRPKYGVADDNLIQISYGNLRADPDNIDGAIAITPSRNGEERTPGIPRGAATERCDALLKEAGMPTTFENALGGVGGFACNQFWMMEAAMKHAASIEPTALAAGLQRAKSVEFSYPTGPNEFTGDRVTTGGQFWRVAQYFRECECWRVTDPTFRPGYP